MSIADVPVDEEEIRLLLLCGQADLHRGFELIDARWRKAISGRLRHWFPGLPAEDLPEIWQDTLLRLLHAVQSNDFDPDRPLEPYLWTVAKARATDRLRRQTTRDEAIPGIAAGLQGCSLASITPAELTELREFLRSSVAALPHKQRVVLQAWIDGYPDTTDMQLLRKEVSLVTGQEETLAAVKRALQEARRKTRDFLTRKGYRMDTAP